MKGILARKIGMTRIISPEDGEMVPVTVLEAPKSIILQVKSQEKDGYNALVLGSFERKHFGKNTNKKYRFIQEIRDLEGEYKKGDCLSLETLKETKTLCISGVSKGKGFAGVIKRHNFQRGRETHGSTHHREPGSVGMCAKPGRILRGKKMPGHMGAEKVTLRSVPIVHIDTEKNLIALKGAIPGAKNSFIFVYEK